MNEEGAAYWQRVTVAILAIGALVSVLNMLNHEKRISALEKLSTPPAKSAP